MEVSKLSSTERWGRLGWRSLMIYPVKYSIWKATATATTVEDRANHFESTLA